VAFWIPPSSFIPPTQRLTLFLLNGRFFPGEGIIFLFFQRLKEQLFFSFYSSCTTVPLLSRNIDVKRHIKCPQCLPPPSPIVTLFPSLLEKTFSLVLLFAALSLFGENRSFHCGTSHSFNKFSPSSIFFFLILEIPLFFPFCCAYNVYPHF